VVRLPIETEVEGGEGEGEEHEPEEASWSAAVGGLDSVSATTF
jgi:hypothetical protein